MVCIINTRPVAGKCFNARHKSKQSASSVVKHSVTHDLCMVLQAKHVGNGLVGLLIVIARGSVKIVKCSARNRFEE